MTQLDRVIIAGAGPVGLTTALTLAKSGVPVLLLEAESHLAPDERGAAMHPPTLEIFAHLGIIDEVLEQGVLAPTWQIRDRDEGVIAIFDLSALAADTPHPYRLHLGQQYLSQILLRHLKADPHVEIRFNTRVVAVEQASGHVAVEVETLAGRETLQGKWLIGADGGRSTIRKALDIEFTGYTWPERFVVNNIKGNLGNATLENANYITTPESWAVVHKLSERNDSQLWRFTYPADADTADEALLDHDNVRNTVKYFLHDHAPFSISHNAIYRVHQRVAETFRKDRAFLAGDAAHINNPLGGFGLNSGIHDAANLAEKLIAVWHGKADEELLDRYVRQRRHANVAYVQASSIRNKKVLEEQDPGRRKAAHDELRSIVADPARAKAYMLNSAMITSIREAAAID